MWHRAPAGLDRVRDGTIFFSHHLARFSDAALDGPTLLEGWTRRHLVAHVASNASALGRLLDGTRTGSPTPMYSSAAAREREINDGSRLPSHTIRNHFAATAARFDVDCATLPDELWDEPVRTAQGRVVPAAETLWLRTREVWVHAVDLNNGADFDDFPADLLTDLLHDIGAVWHRTGRGVGLALMPTDRSETVRPHPGTRDTTVLHGTAAALARWATGRGSHGVAAGSDTTPAPPRWL